MNWFSAWMSTNQPGPPVSILKRRQKRELYLDSEEDEQKQTVVTFSTVNGGENRTGLVRGENGKRYSRARQERKSNQGKKSWLSCFTSKKESCSDSDEGELLDREHDCGSAGCSRININVSGLVFTTYEAILNRHPQTLLGCAQKRNKYYDPHKDEYFFDRHRPSFEAIFHYYMYGGKIRRPLTVPNEIFLNELDYFQVNSSAIDEYKKNEGFVKENIVLPENPTLAKVWILFEYPDTSAPAYFIAIVSVIMTIISIVLFCVETLPVFSLTHCAAGEKPNFLDSFFLLETICTAWFTLECIIRFIACPSKLMYFKDFKNIVDITAVIPYYVTLTNVLVAMSCDGAKGSASLAFLRVIRLIRVFKLTKHSAGLQVLVWTFRESAQGLTLFLAALGVCILLFSSIIYYVELGPDTQMESIPDAFWWAVVTMCTVGYGDKYPVGVTGKVVGALCALAGVLTLAIPVPIITENFNKFYAYRTGRRR